MTSSDSPEIRVDRPYVGIPSFLRAPICTDINTLDADIAVVGVPTDEGSPFMAGSRFGPRAIREHSLRFCAGGRGYYNPETQRIYLDHEMRHRSITDIGDVDVLPTNVEKTFDNITRTVRRILDRGAMPVVLGGDHAITYPVVRAYDEPLHVLHFDAHTDYAPFIHDLRFTNGHAFRHIKPMAHLQHSEPDRDPQPAPHRGHGPGLDRRRQPGGYHERVPPDRSPGDSGHRALRGEVLRQYRRRRPGSLPRAGLRLRGTERHDLCGAARHPGSESPGTPRSSVSTSWR